MGVILQVRVVNGMVKPGDKIQLMSNGKTFDVTEVGIFTPKAVGRDYLATGDVGLYCGLNQDRCGYPCRGYGNPATNPASEPLHGYKQMNPMVLPVFTQLSLINTMILREAFGKIAIE